MHTQRKLKSKGHAGEKDSVQTKELEKVGKRIKGRIEKAIARKEEDVIALCKEE